MGRDLGGLGRRIQIEVLGGLQLFGDGLDLFGLDELQLLFLNLLRVRFQIILIQAFQLALDRLHLALGGLEGAAFSPLRRPLPLLRARLFLAARKHGLELHHPAHRQGNIFLGSLAGVCLGTLAIQLGLEQVQVAIRQLLVAGPGVQGFVRNFHLDAIQLRGNAVLVGRCIQSLVESLRRENGFFRGVFLQHVGGPQFVQLGFVLGTLCGFGGEFPFQRFQRVVGGLALRVGIAFAAIAHRFECAFRLQSFRQDVIVNHRHRARLALGVCQGRGHISGCCRPCALSEHAQHFLVHHVQFCQRVRGFLAHGLGLRILIGGTDHFDQIEMLADLLLQIAGLERLADHPLDGNLVQ